MISVTNCCNGQTLDSLQNDILINNIYLVGKDTIEQGKDSMIKKVSEQLWDMKDESINGLTNSSKSIMQKNKDKLGAYTNDSAARSLYSINSLKELLFKKPFFKMNGGFITYNMNYRSAIDTPFAEKNILQHNAYGNFNVSIANIPFNVNYLFRRSNSSIYRNINDVQVVFDAMQFNNNIKRLLTDKFSAAGAAPQALDSVLCLPCY